MEIDPTMNAIRCSAAHLHTVSSSIALYWTEIIVHPLIAYSPPQLIEPLAPPVSTIEFYLIDVVAPEFGSSVDLTQSLGARTWW
jgi:hypothetical protein